MKLFLLPTTNNIKGLRLLEACIDTLSPAFLDPILERYKSDLVTALWRHVKPPPYAHGHAAIKLLGKLSGRSITLQRPSDRLVKTEKRNNCNFNFFFNI